MVSQRDRDILREDLRARNGKLSAADRESIIKPYLPDPADLTPQRHASQRKQRRGKAPRKTPIRTFLKSQLHQITYTIIHIVFGICVRLIHTYHAIVDRILAIVYYHHRTPELIRKDVRGLKRLPEHLSVVLSLRKEDDDALAVLMDDVAELAAWSTCPGIPVLSIYEKTGILKSCMPTLYQVITEKLSAYYGTPEQQPALRLFAPHHPIYDHDQSTPDAGTGNVSGAAAPKTNHSSITILLLSATDGRETFVDLTKTLAEMAQHGKLSPEDITIDLVDAEISEITTQPSTFAHLAATRRDSFPPVKAEPDLLLVFGPYLKLDGYPPWHIRLTEIFCTGDRSNGTVGFGDAVEYQGFLRGLWHYAGAQMRFGR